MLRLLISHSEETLAADEGNVRGLASDGKLSSAVPRITSECQVTKETRDKDDPSALHARLDHRPQRDRRCMQCRQVRRIHALSKEEH